MAVELKVPEVGESIKEVQIGRWLKGQGEAVHRDQPLVEIESDKATVELPAPVAGTLSRLLKREGEKAMVGEVIGYMEPSDGAAVTTPPASPVATVPAAASVTEEPKVPEAVHAKTKEPEPEDKFTPDLQAEPETTVEDGRIMPSARRELAQRGISPNAVTPTGPGGRLLKEDVLRHAEARNSGTDSSQPNVETAPSPVETSPVSKADSEPAPVAKTDHTMPAPPPPSATAGIAAGSRVEESVPMSPMRKRIAERLLEAQQNAALLTTFNEVDMGAVMELREQNKEIFMERHGLKLGFMSFFVKATIDALKQYPQINAEIRGDSLIYRNYYDIGIAIGSGKGLIVPILRNAELMDFADIERAIADFSKRARENKIKLDELQGGTFTISNGGIYGSLLSTPIVNPPQSGILGMHAIQDRPVARNGQVVIRPMMYVALTYDHRVVDGREAVSFLRRVKECVESPARLLLGT